MASVGFKLNFIGVTVLSLIAYFSLRYYFLNKKNKKHLFFALSFFVMALSFFFKIITNFTLYSRAVRITHIGFLTLTYSSVHASGILFYVGFLIHRILMLTGLFILYLIYSRNSKSGNVLIFYLILLSTYFSKSAYYVFHLTALMFLLIITLQYVIVYRAVKRNANKWLLFSFGLITLSQIIFVFVKLNSFYYVLAETVQLLGYLALLITFIKVLFYGKKKRNAKKPYYFIN